MLPLSTSFLCRMELAVSCISAFNVWLSLMPSCTAICSPPRRSEISPLWISGNVLKADWGRATYVRVSWYGACNHNNKSLCISSRLSYVWCSCCHTYLRHRQGISQYRKADGYAHLCRGSHAHISSLRRSVLPSPSAILPPKRSVHDFRLH